ncbi:MAG TPA: hypothetical protein VLF43_02485 [Candidatus Saccharimonadales bacterium]|nr:hypothetical protein [Candidatus Saccharimonadales bacterium]
MSRNTIGIVVAAIVVFCGVGAIAANTSKPASTPTRAAITQPDTRPSQLTVIPSGSGISSPASAATLQQQSAQTATLGASTNTQSSLLGQPGAGLQAAGSADPNQIR